MADREFRLVVIESPFRAISPEDHVRNVEYARACLRDALKRGDAPMASHLLYTQALDDGDPLQRSYGMEAGWAWFKVAQAVVFYTDLGFSQGMNAALLLAESLKIPVEQRWLGTTAEPWTAKP